MISTQRTVKGVFDQHNNGAVNQQCVFNDKDDDMAYKLVPTKEKTEFDHYFGGGTWKMPICDNCKEQYQQLITLDLSDPMLKEFKHFGVAELPLVSCLNCSSWADYQCFKLDYEHKEVVFVDNEDQLQESLPEDMRFETYFEKVNLKLEEISEGDSFDDEEELCDWLDDLGEDYIIRVGGRPLLFENDIEMIGTCCPKCGEKYYYVAMLANEMPDENNNRLFGASNYSQKDCLLFGEGEIFFYYCPTCQTLHTYSVE